MNVKILLQALGRVWFIEETAAYMYASYIQQIIEGNGKIDAGWFTDGERPYRAGAEGKSLDGPVFVLPVSGVMMKDDFCGEMGTARMASMIAAANRDPSIESIVMKMDTPGGSVSGTETFSQAVKASQKPVVTYADMMCSAGYWAGSSAREIIIGGETSIVGSIGTMATMVDSRKADEKDGYRTVHVFASRSIHKNAAALAALDDKPEAYRKEILDPMNAAFESAVTTNRAGKINLKKEDVCTGKVYIGSEAVKHGLADKVGSLDYAIKRSLQLARNLN